jgi:chromatin remodeling complex protein RSC6
LNGSSPTNKRKSDLVLNSKRPTKKRKTSKKTSTDVSSDEDSEYEDQSAIELQRQSSKNAFKQKMRDSYDRERTVSDSLAELIGTKVTTRREATKLVWAYVREHNLQGSNKNHVSFDAALQKALNTTDVGVNNAVTLSSYVYRQFLKDDDQEADDSAFTQATPANIPASDKKNKASTSSGQKLLKDTLQDVVTEGAQKFFGCTSISPADARSRVKEHIREHNLSDAKDSNIVYVDQTLRIAFDIASSIETISVVPGVAQYVRRVLSSKEKKPQSAKTTKTKKVKTTAPPTRSYSPVAPVALRSTAVQPLQLQQQLNDTQPFVLPSSLHQFVSTTEDSAESPKGEDPSLVLAQTMFQGKDFLADYNANDQTTQQEVSNSEPADN